MGCGASVCTWEGGFAACHVWQGGSPFGLLQTRNRRYPRPVVVQALMRLWALQVEAMHAPTVDETPLTLAMIDDLEEEMCETPEVFCTLTVPDRSRSRSRSP